VTGRAPHISRQQHPPPLTHRQRLPTRNVDR
jgi:hypothetical protein